MSERVRNILIVSLLIMVTIIIAIALFALPGAQPLKHLGTDTAQSSNQGPIMDYKLQALHDQDTPLSLSDFRKRPVLVHFWATWCPPCIEEMPILLDSVTLFNQQNPDKAIHLLTVSVDHQTAKARDFLDQLARQFKNEDNITHSYDQRMQVAMGQYQVMQFPASFLHDSDGRLVYRHIGPRGDWHRWLQQSFSN